MEYLVVALLWILNFGISWWNAHAAGRVWVEAKFAGGWQRFMTWMAALMSASGFTWCILIFLALSGHVVDPKHFSDRVVTVSLELGYIVLIPGYDRKSCTGDGRAAAYPW
jgi:hypothetical protein